MKETGIVRRMDELGRVVIPKEIRKTLRIQEGDPLEIFIEREQLILQKYSPIGSLNGLARCVVDLLYETIGLSIGVFDTDTVLAVKGTLTKDFDKKTIADELLKVVKSRKTLICDGENNFVKITNDDDMKNSFRLIVPVAFQGDLFGGIVVVSKEPIEGKAISLTAFLADFLARQV